MVFLTFACKMIYHLKELLFFNGVELYKDCNYFESSSKGDVSSIYNWDIIILLRKDIANWIV